jgi:hypothetical protein
LRLKRQHHSASGGGGAIAATAASTAAVPDGEIVVEWAVYDPRRAHKRLCLATLGSQPVSALVDAIVAAPDRCPAVAGAPPGPAAYFFCENTLYTDRRAAAQAQAAPAVLRWLHEARASDNDRKRRHGGGWYQRRRANWQRCRRAGDWRRCHGGGWYQRCTWISRETEGNIGAWYQRQRGGWWRGHGGGWRRRCANSNRETAGRRAGRRSRQSGCNWRCA